MTQEDETRAIQEIEAAARSAQTIPATSVRAWISSSSLEVQGALTHLLLEQARMVEPPLTWAEICPTFENYYKECLIQDVRQSDRVPNRYIAGYELVNWFRYLWGEGAAPRKFLLSLKAMLRELYLKNEGLRDAIVNAVLEHLFENAAIQEFFDDWRSDPALGKAYALAKEWGDEHVAASQN